MFPCTYRTGVVMNNTKVSSSLPVLRARGRPWSNPAGWWWIRIWAFSATLNRMTSVTHRKYDGNKFLQNTVFHKSHFDDANANIFSFSQHVSTINFPMTAIKGRAYTSLRLYIVIIIIYTLNTYTRRIRYIDSMQSRYSKDWPIWI